MKNSFPLAQKMLPEIYSTVDMIMKGRPLLVLLLFAASAVILAGMYYAATREGTTTRQDKWAGVLSDLDACSRRKHVKSAQYDHFAGIARQEREHDAERLFRAMAHAERLQEYNCANAIVRLGGRYAPPEHVTVFRGTTDDNLRRSIDFARRPREGLHADDIERALQSGNRYAARVLIWARSGDMRHLALMETCRRRLAANGPEMCIRDSSHTRTGSFVVKIRAIIQIKATDTAPLTTIRTNVRTTCIHERASSEKNTAWCRSTSTIR